MHSSIPTDVQNATPKRKKYPKRLGDEKIPEPPAPEPPPLVRQTYVARDPYAYQQPQLSYKDILMMRQHEMRQARHARQVAPLRNHYGL